MVSDGSDELVFRRVAVPEYVSGACRRTGLQAARARWSAALVAPV
jgi:hypothetical protein